MTQTLIYTLLEILKYTLPALVVLFATYMIVNKFLTTEKIDFSDTNNTEITFVNTSYFLLKKSTTAISAEIKTTTINVSSAQKFQTFTVNDTNKM
jgi:hypothetical protein